MKQLSLEDINLDMIPINVLQDVDKRIADWRAAGGKDSDAYIQNQLRYLKRVELMANNATDTLTYFKQEEITSLFVKRKTYRSMKTRKEKEMSIFKRRKKDVNCCI